MIFALFNAPIWIVLAIVLGLGVLLFALTRQKGAPRLASVAVGLLISYSTLLILLLCGEAYYRFVYADSGWGFTLAHRNWESRYWHLNQAGFRDRDWTAADLEGRTNITVIGDSFASGWGVDDPADRFPDVLGRLLGDDYAVVNLAVPGMSTAQELETLQNQAPGNPDIIILQYFLNDIELASASISRLWVADFVEAPAEGSLAEQSYLANYIYWIIYPITRPVNTTFEGSYWQWLYETYDNFAIWDIHQSELQAVMDYSNSIGAELYVVIFPNMEDPVASIPYVDRVKFAFEEGGFADRVMTLYDEVAGWDQSEPLVASPRDAHPSAAFHRYVATLIFERWFSGD